MYSLQHSRTLKDVLVTCGLSDAYNAYKAVESRIKVLEDRASQHSVAIAHCATLRSLASAKKQMDDNPESMDGLTSLSDKYNIWTKRGLAIPKDETYWAECLTDDELTELNELRQVQHRITPFVTSISTIKMERERGRKRDRQLQGANVFSKLVYDRIDSLESKRDTTSESPKKSKLGMRWQKFRGRISSKGTHRSYCSSAASAHTWTQIHPLPTRPSKATRI
jgi:hypothetical protein